MMDFRYTRQVLFAMELRCSKYLRQPEDDCAKEGTLNIPHSRQRNLLAMACVGFSVITREQKAVSSSTIAPPP